MDIDKILKENDIYSFILNIEDKDKQKEIFSKCRVKEYRKGESIYFTPETDELTKVFLSGRVNMVVYIDDIADHTVTWNNDIWFGIANALSEDVRECEIIFKEDTKVLFFPLKDILYGNPKENIKLWMKISKMAARKALQVQRKAVERGALSTEAYFLLSLTKNGYCYEGVSVKDISHELNINLRTLQRAINLLEKGGYIKRDRSKKSISAQDKEKVDSYLASIIKE